MAVNTILISNVCNYCDEQVHDNCRALNCDICRQSFHIKCITFGQVELAYAVGQSFWLCKSCIASNFHSEI